MALQSGAVDIAAHLSVTQSESLGSDYNILEGTMNLVQAMYLNNKVKPFDDVRVRQALCYAVDVDGILQLTEDGRGTKVGSSMDGDLDGFINAYLTGAANGTLEK